MTTDQIIKMATEVMADCPLNQFFQWLPKPGLRTLVIPSAVWNTSAGAEFAFDYMRRTFEKTLFQDLKNDLARAARPGRENLGSPIICGRDYAVSGKNVIYDQYPIRAVGPDLAKYDWIAPLVRIPKTEKMMASPLYLNANYEFVLQPQQFITDAEDALSGGRVSGRVIDDHGYKHAQLSVTIPEHAPGEVLYWAHLRENFREIGVRFPR